MAATDETPPAITSSVAPDLGAVETFIADMIAKGAFAALVAAIVALLARMRDLNMELMKKLASQSRKRPPNEEMRRLQMELPLLFTPPANDAAAAPAPPLDPKGKKRGAKKPTAHGRPKLPAHLPRVPDVRLVGDDKRTCPQCNVGLARVCLKTTAEKLDVRPSQFIVTQTQVETCSCPKCHQYIVTADKGDEVLDRGILGNELLVQSLVDHYDDATPWERMERNARAEGAPLAANTVASSVGRVIDLFDPVLRHIRAPTLPPAMGNTVVVPNAIFGPPGPRATDAQEQMNIQARDAAVGEGCNGLLGHYVSLPEPPPPGYPPDYDMGMSGGRWLVTDCAARPGPGSELTFHLAGACRRPKAD